MRLGWNEVSEAVHQLHRSKEREFSPETIRNAEDFIAHARVRLAPPEHIGPGYWPTLQLGWDCSPPISVEIFDDSYEIYRIHEGRTDIFEFAHGPGQPFPEKLNELLVSTCAQLPKSE